MLYPTSLVSPWSQKKKSQPPKFTEEQRAFIVKIMQRAGATISRAIRSFYRKYHTSISSRTIRRILKTKRLVYRTLYIRTKVKRARKQFVKAIQGLPIDRLLSVDEMGFSHGHVHPRKAWCYQRHTNRIYRQAGRFQRYNKTVTCLTSSKHIVNYEWSGKPMNASSFAEFLRVSLPGYTGYSLILDNVSFHRAKRVVSVLEEFGVTPIYIDPYTPEQNPIEEVFSSIKTYVRQRSPRSNTAFDVQLRRAMCKQSPRVLSKYFTRSLQHHMR